MVVGTYALIQSEVKFKHLAVAVIDEQHRFGVRQRAALVEGDPHMLVMTATPIPRTLALTARGLRTLRDRRDAPGRAAIKTRVVPPEKRDAMYQYIRDRQAQGEQAACSIRSSRIPRNRRGDRGKRVTTSCQTARSRAPTAMLHGRMSMSEKDE